MNGVKYSNEYQYRSKIKQENKITQSQMMERNQKRSHLTVIDGNVYQIRTKQKIS
jgi:LysM repeat protein